MHTAPSPAARGLSPLAWCLPLLLALAAWGSLHFRGSPVNQYWQSLSVTALLAALLLGMALLSARGQTLALPRRPALLAMVLLVGWAQASVLWSVSQTRTVVEWWNLLPLFLGFALGTAGRQLDEGVWRAMLAAVVLAVLGTLPEAWQQILVQGKRPSGPLLDANLYADALLTALALAVLLARQAGGRGAHLLWLGASAALAATLSKSGSRGATLAALVFLLLLGAAWWARRGQVPRRDGHLPEHLLLLVPVLAYALAVLVDQGSSAATLARHSALDGNVRLWLVQAAWSMFQDSPLLGNGYGSFYVLYPGHRNPAEYYTEGMYAHNDYMQVLAEGGPLALLALLALPLCALWAWWRAWGGRRQGMDPGLVVCAAAVCGLSAHALFNFVYVMPSQSLLIGLLLAGIHASAPAREARPRLLLISALVALPLAALAWVDAAIYSALAGHTLGGAPLSAQARLARMGALEQWRPGNHLPAFFLADSAAEAALSSRELPRARRLEIARASLQWWGELLATGERGEPAGLLTVSRLLEAFPELSAEAERAFGAGDPLALARRAAALNPDLFGAHLAVMRLLEQRESAQAAAAYASAAMAGASHWRNRDRGEAFADYCLALAARAKAPALERQAQVFRRELLLRGTDR